MSIPKKDESDANILPNRLSFGFLNQIFPKHLLEEILDSFKKNSQRIRKLPAVATMYFVIILSLWRDVSIEEVLKITLHRLYPLGTDIDQNVPKKSSISEARSKLGAEPFSALAFKILQPMACVEDIGSWYRGHLVMALDGSTFDLPDEVENANFYGYPSTSRGSTAFPQSRVLSLVETGTHAIVAAQIGPYRISEQAMANKIFLSGKLEPGMILLADRNFYGYPLWSLACSTGAKLLWRVKLGLKLPVEEILPDGSYISTVYDSKNKKKCVPLKVRVIEYKLDDKNDPNSKKKVGQELYRIITNIYSPEEAPAEELAALYHERWEIENLFGELKSRLLKNKGTEVRSRTPILVEQELWGVIIIHYALRKLITEGARKEKKDPDKLSFISTVYIVRRRLPELVDISPAEMTIDKENEVYALIVIEVSETRCSSSRGKVNPRGVKRKMSNFRVRSRSELLNLVRIIKPKIIMRT